MEKSSHYYALLAFCLANGVKTDTALKISYASQFVDDAKINFIKFAERYPEPIFGKLGNVSILSDIATCHSYFKIMTFNYHSMILNTALFHFFPGNKGTRFTEKLVCVPSPDILEGLIRETVSTVPLPAERLGLLLHIYADTFAHQGFSGLLSIENDIRDLKTDEINTVLGLVTQKFKKAFLKSTDSVFDSFIPSYGHAQALDNPDVPFRKWSYNSVERGALGRFNEKNDIDNSARYREAFAAISALLAGIQDRAACSGQPISAAEQNRLCEVLVKKQKVDKKITAWRSVITGYDRTADKAYDENEWLSGCFKDFNKKKFAERTVENAELISEYRSTSWYRFIESARWYKEEALARLAREGLTLPV